MDINRADAKLIRADERRKALADFGIANAAPLAIGTEAEVYELAQNMLLKLYADTSRLSHFQTLQNLYNTVDATPSGLNLPQIHNIVPYEYLIVIVETRLTGEPLENLLPDLKGAHLAQAEELYLNTAWKLKEVKITEPPTAYLLFDKLQVSDTSQQSFEAFYASFLERKIVKIGRFFLTTSPSFLEKAAALVQIIRDGNPAPLALVHGDFFPGNMLVDKEVTQAQGIIDFGSFTLFGNYLLDIAGAFGFYKMYDPERQQNRQKMLPHILDRLTTSEQPRFFQFLLAHAILTADLYATTPDPRADDHFRWAADIVAQEPYWDGAL